MMRSESASSGKRFLDDVPRPHLGSKSNHNLNLDLFIRTATHLTFRKTTMPVSPLPETTTPKRIANSRR